MAWPLILLVREISFTSPTCLLTTSTQPSSSASLQNPRRCEFFSYPGEKNLTAWSEFYQKTGRERQKALKHRIDDFRFVACLMDAGCWRRSDAQIAQISRIGLITNNGKTSEE
ncbi:hypothetical protein DL95DRAFT_387668 [Leptodontidium sp. 2 PMI_412]|nr:hypothetical protein DL95DRAFT_387668 [Leptodontidium sp. 2 PMI_412]